MKIIQHDEHCPSLEDDEECACPSVELTEEQILEAFPVRYIVGIDAAYPLPFEVPRNIWMLGAP